MHSALFRPAVTACEAKEPPLTPKDFRTFPVRKVESLTHNTKRITLRLPHPKDDMGMTPASMVLVRALIDGKPVVRPYTPTNLNEDLGRIELVIKSYPQGTMSKHLGTLKVGDHLDVKGPIVKFKYVPNQYNHIGMIGGGTGITPMLQLARAICLNPDDNTRVTLICANVTENDMLLREELDELQKKFPQLKVHHVLSAPSGDWKGWRGFISSRMVYELMPKPDASKFLICVCGPPAMMQHVCGDKAPDYSQGELHGLLEQLGYKAEQVFKF